VGFDDFFQNHFGPIYKKHVAMTQGLPQRINILLTYANHNAVLAALRQEYPEEVSAHEADLQYEPIKRAR